MNRKFFLGVFFVTAMVAGLFYLGQVSSAQKRGQSVRTEVARPEAGSASQALFVEDFTGPIGSTLPGNNGWFAHSAPGTTPATIQSAAMTYPGYPSSGIGNAVAMGTAGEDVSKVFAVQNTGSVYAAVMINVSASQVNGDYFFHLVDGPITGNSFKGRLFVKKDATAATFGIGIQKSSTANALYTPTTFATGVTHLCVVKYTFVAGTANDTVELIIDPTLGGAEPASNLTATLATDADATDIRGVALRQGAGGSAATVQVDGIRIARTWDTILAPAPNKVADFNGDGRTDYATYRNNSGQLRWFYGFNNIGGSSEQDWGSAGDTVIPGDFDGDGKTDVAVWRGASGTDSAFYIYQSSNGTIKIDKFGLLGDDPTVVGDYDGDGKADVAVYRPGATSTWFYRGSLSNPNGNITYIPWGSTGDKVAPGDYDGDGKSDACIWRAGTYWESDSSTGATVVRSFGLAGDTTVPGDYDGDGKTDLAVIRSDGVSYSWYWQPSAGGVLGLAVWGSQGDIAVPGDYDGDGKTDPAVWKPSSGSVWLSRFSSNLGYGSVVFGGPSDGAVAAFGRH